MAQWAEHIPTWYELTPQWIEDGTSTPVAKGGKGRRHRRRSDDEMVLLAFLHSYMFLESNNLKGATHG